jgi:hypothetical protein
MREPIRASEMASVRFARYAPVLLVSALLGLGVGCLLVILKRRPAPTTARVTQMRPAPGGVSGGSFQPVTANRTTVSPGQGKDQIRTGSPRLPVLVRDFQKVPEPLHERSDPVEAYNGQERNPIWAPKMETALRTRFANHPPAAVGMEGLEISVTECRDNTCRIDFTYPASMLHLSAPEGFPFKRFTPLDIYIWKTGRFATSLKNLPPTHLPDGTARETIVVAFESPAIDPEHYPTWASTRTAPAKRAQSSQQQEVAR